MITNSFDEAHFSVIAENIKKIKEEIAEATIKSNRSVDDVRLMAVTKTVCTEYINYAIENCGIDLIGENKVQELLSKYDGYNLDACSLQFIGHLQSNKVRQIVDKVDMIQSVDSLHLAQVISKESEKFGITSNILLEINIGDEESKTGFSMSEFFETLHEIAELDAIRIKGLMTIPPICENNTILCKYFEKIHNIYVDIKEKKLDNIDMNILSMGMSGDYEQAILCGSNLVRIGSSIFGPRIY